MQPQDPNQWNQQNVQQPYGYQQQPGAPQGQWPQQPQPPKEAWYQSPPVALISLLFCFPLGLYGVWTSPKFSKNARIGITAGWAVFMIIAMASGNGDKSKEASKEDKASKAATSATTEVAKASTTNEKPVAVAASTAAPAKSAEPSLKAVAEEKPARSEVFPTVVDKFEGMNELQQEDFAKDFRGVSLSGKGEVDTVEKCGFADDSKKWGRKCLKVTLWSASEKSRVALYFPEDKRDEIKGYKKGTAVQFKDCITNSIKNWGFWCTATCDMP